MEQPTANKVDRSRAQLPLAWLVAVSGVVIMFAPTLKGLATDVWQSDRQGHGPVVFAIFLWLLWRAYPKVRQAADGASGYWLGGVLLALASVLYVTGRSLEVPALEVVALPMVIAAVVLWLAGPAGLRPLYFALFFAVFLIPYPSALIDAVTQPMKIMVSWVAEWLLFHAGYPIARAGVTLQIGQYQLLVADACAGLSTLFTLEAIGLLYLNVIRHSSLLRNVMLAILIVPISFLANITRVVVLILVTYYFGDEAGQGFLHGFSGMVLYFVALALLISFDTMLRGLGQLLRRRQAAA